MDYQAREIIILKNDEFMLMLAAAGIDEWYGIDLNDADITQENDKSLNESLISLYQKNIISWGEERAHIDDRYRPLMRVLKEASVCVTAVTVFRPGYIKGSYFSGGNVVVVERRTASSDELEISMLPFSGWADELEAEGYCPQTMSPEQDDDIADFGEEFISEFELRSLPGGELKQTVRLYEYGLYGMIEMDDGAEKVREPFSRDMLTELLKEWTGGNE